MANDQIFSVANLIALIGWIILLFSPLMPRIAQWISGIAIPVILAIVYSAIIFTAFGGSQGGFTSIGDLMILFAEPKMVLVGWVHYLAFDLFIGAWECRTARAESIRFWLVIPCLLFTFLLGPVGLLLFLIIRAIHRSKGTSPMVSDAA